MTSPFGWVSERAQPWLLGVLTLLVVGLSLWLSSLGEALATAAAPHGIVSFELARDAARSAAILGSWPERAREAAFLLQGLDYLYLLAYPAWFSLAAARLGARLGGAWQRAGIFVAWVVLAAAPLDAVENLALIRQLRDGASELHAALAWGCAVPKFFLIGVAAAYLMAASAAWALARLRSR